MPSSRTRGFALVRTNNEVPKHKGITFMVIDMQAPGITIRPLRQITGSVEFNEVFFDEVFVPDADVVGQVDGGWSIGRTALGNERVSLGGIGWKSSHWRELQDRALERSVRSPAILHELGLLTAKWMAVEALNVRAAARAVAGKSSDLRGNVTKLIATELKQRTADFGLRVLAEEGVYVDQDSASCPRSSCSAGCTPSPAVPPRSCETSSANGCLGCRGSPVTDGDAAVRRPREVRSSIVIGLPDEDLSQRVHAIVETTPGVAAEDILDHLKDRLVRYKIPRSVELVDGPLRDEAGKVRRSRGPPSRLVGA